MRGRAFRSICVWETLHLDVCNLTYIPHTKATNVIEFSPNARSWHYCSISNGRWMINFIVNLLLAESRQRLFVISLCYLLHSCNLSRKSWKREKKILTKFGQCVQPRRHWPTIYPKGDRLRLQWEQQIHRQPTEKKREESCSQCGALFFMRRSDISPQ